jgi:DNA-binding XRE family transcriptional regulator
MNACTDQTKPRLTGGQLRRLRAALGMRQEELAALSFVSRATISMHESQPKKLLPNTLGSYTLTGVLLRDARVRVDEDGTIHVRIPPE